MSTYGSKAATERRKFDGPRLHHSSKKFRYFLRFCEPDKESVPHFSPTFACAVIASPDTRVAIGLAVLHTRGGHDRFANPSGVVGRYESAVSLREPEPAQPSLNEPLLRV